ncbi:hypothetical protein M758_8G032100 [Ceratodon purpureus]|uniref:Uncharacterized protein n=1 Tax=Ceratodon purpureus TaxID=3225 RepID=A0A8T0GX23_CERPU|nr:hypothetical protein KC19_8G032700 [Ceratodon purpureus]KAG0607478.1 hypothetical protein M758_8G032100 [Ceratodon purpureus]
MADGHHVELTIPSLGRNVVAHQCEYCRCVGVDSLRRSGSSSSEASVGTGTSLLLPDQVAGSEGSTGARYRGGAGSGGAVPNGAVNVDIDGSESGVVRGSAVTEDDDTLYVADIVASNLEELNSGRYTKLKLAFDDWEKSLETSLKRREYKEALRDAIRNEIYQVIGFYIVFQGVIFTAVAQASVLRCHNWWTSFLLSLLTSLVTIGVVLQKLQDFWALETTIASEIVTAKVLKNRISDVKLKVGPARFSFKKHALDGPKDTSKPRSGVQLYRFAVITVLLCFSAIFLVSSWRTLCRSGTAPP